MTVSQDQRRDERATFGTIATSVAFIALLLLASCGGGDRSPVTRDEFLRSCMNSSNNAMTCAEAANSLYPSPEAK